MGEDIVYLHPPNWWPEPIPEGHVLLLEHLWHQTSGAKWHNHILEWMINNGYLAVDSKKTIFKKTKGSEYIIHVLFVDDMMHISSCDELKKEFIDKYSKDFEITGGGLLKTFLGMEVEQSGKTIKLHLDCYIQQVLAEYKAYIKKMLRPKKVLISPCVILNPEDVPELLDQRKQSHSRRITNLLWRSSNLR
jgi:hypothetical protein